MPEEIITNQRIWEELQEMKQDIKEIKKNFYDFEIGKITQLRVDVSALQTLLKEREKSQKPWVSIGYDVIKLIIATVVGALLFLVIKH